VSIWGKIFGLDKNPHYEAGIRYFNEGKYEQAVEELEIAVGNTGKSDPLYALGRFYAAESHVHIGTAKFHAGGLEEALAHFEKAVEENPTYPDLYYRMGVIQHRLGRKDEAVVMLGRAIELNKSYFEAVCYLGIVLYEKGEKEEADRVFARALEIGKEMPNPISKFLSTHLSGTETDIQPLAAIKKLIYNDTEFESFVKKGVEAFNTGDFEQAVDAFRSASNVHPDYADIRFKLGLSLLRRSDLVQAEAELDAALEINPNYSEARYYLGITFLNRCMYPEALPHFERAAAEKPGYADIQCYLGATYFFLGELEKAKEVLERALELSPKYTKAHYYYGLLLYSLGDTSRAIESLTRAMNGEEGVEDASMSLALAHLREEHLEEAMTVLRDILEAGGESADILYFIGEVYLKMGKMEEAEQFLRKALDVNPDFLRAKEKLAGILVKRREYSEAEQLLENPGAEYADIFKIIGDIKFYNGDLDAAEDSYRRSLKVNAEYEEATLSLALTLRKKGKNREADGLLRHLLELDPKNVLARNLLGPGPLDLETP
jgi:tetratricopeptide (TPR) repeat protein